MITQTKPSKKESKFQKLFIDEIKDIYWAEKHLVKALPKMSKGATSSKLSAAIDKHLAETKEHVNRLEEVFDILGVKPQAKKCDAMDGLVKEAESILEDTDADTMVRDAGIIIASQKVEHYEIASYGTLVAFATKMGLKDAAKILSKTLNEEKETDSNLTKMAESEINEEAASE
ncbi:ferritin-like domain-containing protein [Algoriphagus sp. D3-2-R+10]|uniref:YciE/YciF ferroxidase family protein n=1 Tax=Algoriphagus aurantiacus TaxID=3103948 RepID=UPI002B383788|nr:ferritin-like domain-containing protein [Algoriphagus sp. D3-2-R+10]MEB2778528.1 ferritin-like domain-containing protein [Algoriphagus sp. D3-2-R+10]